MLAIACAALTQAWPGPAAAHGGGLDAYGCHHNRRTGEYHCHRSATRTAPDRPADARRTDREGCGAKRYCTEMTSCREAMRYYRDCGLSRLDGDQDGVPCENLCGRR